MGLLGPNGAGKSTLIRILVGLLKPQRGSIHVFGEPPSITNTSRIGYMPQLSALYRELSAMENVDFFARMYGLRSKQRRRERVEEVIRLVNLWERRNDPLLHLSGGMRQRVSLACAIVHSPPLLLLDEPTVGLDPELRVSFWEYFHKLTASGVTLVISSHTMDDAAHCDRLVFLRTGRLIAEGTPQGLCQATGRAEATLEEAFLYFIRRK
ncbi:MAG: ABC transporter ATP-binding protein [Chloroflexi bacterium]|nr:ABC transporter ATP-binding protein [Chloroflexota bacterium]